MKTTSQFRMNEDDDLPQLEPIAQPTLKTGLISTIILVQFIALIREKIQGGASIRYKKGPAIRYKKVTL